MWLTNGDNVHVPVPEKWPQTQPPGSTNCTPRGWALQEAWVLREMGLWNYPYGLICRILGLQRVESHHSALESWPAGHWVPSSQGIHRSESTVSCLMPPGRPPAWRRPSWAGTRACCSLSPWNKPTGFRQAQERPAPTVPGQKRACLKHRGVSLDPFLPAWVEMPPATARFNTDPECPV